MEIIIPNDILIGVRGIARDQSTTNEGNGMTANVGSIDRIVRIVVGLGLIVATLMGVIGIWGWLGVIVLATGIVGVCPAYLPFRINTCQKT